jgi:hypothetical protein
MTLVFFLDWCYFYVCSYIISESCGSKGLFMSQVKRYSLGGCGAGACVLTQEGPALYKLMAYGLWTTLYVVTRGQNSILIIQRG